MSVQTPDYVKNLKMLCAERPSVAQICREMGIKQQQFSRYLTGRNVPSLHTRHRIARYFGVSENELSLEHAEFAEGRKFSRQFDAYTSMGALLSAFPGNLPEMRQYLGSYHYYLMSPSHGTDVTIGATFMREEDGQILTESTENATPVGKRAIRVARYTGMACHRGGRIFNLEFEQAPGGCVTEAILTPSHRRAEITLHGICVALASTQGRPVYASRIVFKKLPQYMDRQQILSVTGICPLRSQRISPNIRAYLSEGRTINSSTNAFI